MMTFDELKDFLDFKVLQYNSPNFIIHDPVSVPHQFTQKEDIEIAAFLTATISWGNRKAIVLSANKLMSLLQHEPYNFVINASNVDLKRLSQFVYRTYNSDDLIHFIYALRNIYKHHKGLEAVFSANWHLGAYHALFYFRTLFFSAIADNKHVSKHVADVSKGASAKRLNMFLRWMVRKDNNGVDFGLWSHMGAEKLMLPLDLHTGNVGRKLGLLSRRQNDWKAVDEITAKLRLFDEKDPVKYDFALFGLGINEGF